MKTYLKLFAVAFFWGGTFVAGRYLAGSAHPVSAAFFRFAIASVCLCLAVCLAEGQHKFITAERLARQFKVVLDRKLFEKRIFPCINIPESGTRKEEKLYSKEEVEKLYLMRRALSSLSPESAMELLLQKVREFKTNHDFLSSLQLK